MENKNKIQSEKKNTARVVKQDQATQGVIKNVYFSQTIKNAGKTIIINLLLSNNDVLLNYGTQIVRLK